MILVIIFISLFYLVISPPTTPPDEVAHLAYPRTLLLYNQWPSFVTPEDAWESHQPPLYYALSLPLVWISQNVGFSEQVLAQRLTSVMLIVAALVLMLMVLRRLFPDDLSARLAGLIVFLLPMTMYMAGAYGNDSLMVFSASLLILLSIPRPVTFSRRQAIIFGFAIGLSLLTKAHLYPLVAVLFLWQMWGRPIRLWLISAVAALGVSGWWFINNLIAVGDVFGLTYARIFWADQTLPIDSWATISRLMWNLGRGFVGVFGKFSVAFPDLVYAAVLIGLVCLLIAVAAIYRRQHATYVPILLIAIGTAVSAVIWQNFSFFQPQGRYLLSLVPVFGLIIAVVVHAVPRAVKISSIVLAGALLVLLNVYSLTVVSRYYKTHPVDALTQPRMVDLIDIGWIDPEKKVDQSGAQLVISTPARISSLDDLRLETLRRPTLLIASPSEPFDLIISWKVLGEKVFSPVRRQTVRVDGVTEVVLYEAESTLIQDFQLEFPEADRSIVIKRLEAGNN